MEAVVAAQSSEGTKSDGIGEENLSASINPHLTGRKTKLFHNLLKTNLKGFPRMQCLCASTFKMLV